MGLIKKKIFSKSRINVVRFSARRPFRVGDQKNGDCSVFSAASPRGPAAKRWGSRQGSFFLTPFLLETDKSYNPFKNFGCHFEGFF